MTTEIVPTLLRMEPGHAAPRVAVLTASYGAGHDAAARELSRVLTEAGCEVVVHDLVALLPWRLGPLLRSAYYAQLRSQPDSWSTTLRLLEPGRLLHRVATSLLGLAVDPVVEATRGCELVLTTHPFGAQALGQARRAGKLRAPAVTYLTDTSVHALWIHPDVDLNLAIHEVAAQEAREWGGAAAVVRPLVSPAAVEAASRQYADPLIALGIRGPRVLVTGGSLGVGELDHAARDIVDLGLTPVVLCGTDARLRRRLEQTPGVVALGWRDDLPALLATSDCVVQNAGGFTSLEALVSGTPVVTYRPVPGHGVANSRNLELAGLIPWARTREELAILVGQAMTAPRVERLPVGAPDLLAVLTGAGQPAAAA